MVLSCCLPKSYLPESVDAACRSWFHEFLMCCCCCRSSLISCRSFFKDNVGKPAEENSRLFAGKTLHPLFSSCKAIKRNQETIELDSSQCFLERGLEDHVGDIDFKIAGTRYGVTAMQLDMKLAGFPLDIICECLEPTCKASRTRYSNPGCST